METLRQWAFGICAAAIACGLVQLLMPKSGMRRVFEITVRVFFLATLLSPVVFSLPMELDLSAKEELAGEIAERTKRLQSSVESGSLRVADESVRMEAGRVLNEMGIEYRKIYINVHESETTGISISECEVELPTRYFERHQEIRAALQERLGVQIRIGYKDDE